MHKISHYDILSDSHTDGMVVEVSPPVVFGEGALQGYISTGAMNGNRFNERVLPNDTLKPILIGMSDEKTSFYYPYKSSDHIDQERERVLGRTEEFLSFLVSGDIEIVG